MAVMSATLEAEPVAEYLGGDAGTGETPVLRSEGQSFPVEVRYLSHHDERPVTEQAADVVERIVNAGEPGDILVFMPGHGRDQRDHWRRSGACRVNERLALIPLHGDLPPEQQDLAFAPNPLRKVVVATNVAETSVTIDGIRHVVDSGLARVARYDAERGIGTLFIEPISRASADQRKGRAGRTAPGHLPPALDRKRPVEPPGAQHAGDSAQRPGRGGAAAALAGHQAGGGVRLAGQAGRAGGGAGGAVAGDAGSAAGFTIYELRFTRAGREGHASTGNPRLATGADLTPIGRQMLRLPMHPRYSRMLVEASRYGCVPAAALCAALVSGRDLLMRLGRDDKHIQEARELFEASQESDFYTLMRAYQFAEEERFQRGDLPPLWHSRADGAAGGADLRADHADRAAAGAAANARMEDRGWRMAGASPSSILHPPSSPSAPQRARRSPAPLHHDRVH